MLGPVNPDSIGITLTHEHMHLDISFAHARASDNIHDYIDNNKITINNCGLVAQFPYSSIYNMKLCDADTNKAILDDVRLFKKWGGGTICENSAHGLNGNIKFCKTVAQETGVNILMGTGHYTGAIQTDSTKSLGVEKMVNMYVDELWNGIDVGNNERIKCGFIGEVGTNCPLGDFEKRSIEATALAQEQTGCGVTFHPDLVALAPFEVARLYLEAGGRADKCVMSHLDSKPKTEYYL